MIGVTGVEESQVRVVIADDQASTRRALHAVLAFEPRIVIAGEAANGQEAIQLVGEQRPDLVLMDVHMPTLDGLKATHEIKSRWPGTKVVIYTMFPTESEEAYQAGADYFLIKGSPGVALPEVILSFFPTDTAQR